MASKVNKAFLSLMPKRPILERTLQVFQKESMVKAVILVVKFSQLSRAKRLIKKYGLSKVKQIIAGGATRADSVYRGLQKVDKSFSHVLIHDGVRPLISPRLIRRMAQAGERYHAAICAVRVKPTVKKGDAHNFVQCTIDREDLWEVQTPQVFERRLIMRAYAQAKLKKPLAASKFPPGITDDAMLVERLGKKVKIVQGDYSNIKITTPQDLLFARMLARKRG
jgi:2-C-methyl-D-erythritol 4-phosphate cytidylyltransferase